jgi:hypothetical protein
VVAAEPEASAQLPVGVEAAAGEAWVATVLSEAAVVSDAAVLPQAVAAVVSGAVVLPQAEAVWGAGVLQPEEVEAAQASAVGVRPSAVRLWERLAAGPLAAASVCRRDRAPLSPVPLQAAWSAHATPSWRIAWQ